MKALKRGAPWVVLLGVGLLQMAGDVLGVPAVKGIGLATGMSPAPKVFSAVAGLETYSTRFFIEWDTADGRVVSHELTPELNAKFQGPYNRRNVYGAVLAYGPVLPEAMRGPVTRYGLCAKDGGAPPVLRELFAPAELEGFSGRVRVRLEPLPGTSLGDLPTAWEAACD